MVGCDARPAENACRGIFVGSSSFVLAYNENRQLVTGQPPTSCQMSMGGREIMDDKL